MAGRTPYFGEPLQAMIQGQRHARNGFKETVPDLFAEFVALVFHAESGLAENQLQEGHVSSIANGLFPPNGGVSRRCEIALLDGNLLPSILFTSVHFPPRAMVEQLDPPSSFFLIVRFFLLLLLDNNGHRAIVVGGVHQTPKFDQNQGGKSSYNCYCRYFTCN